MHGSRSQKTTDSLFFNPSQVVGTQSEDWRRGVTGPFRLWSVALRGAAKEGKVPTDWSVGFPETGIIGPSRKNVRTIGSLLVMDQERFGHPGIGSPSPDKIWAVENSRGWSHSKGKGLAFSAKPSGTQPLTGQVSGMLDEGSLGVHLGQLSGTLVGAPLKGGGHMVGSVPDPWNRKFHLPVERSPHAFRSLIEERECFKIRIDTFV